MKIRIESTSATSAITALGVPRTISTLAAICPISVAATIGVFDALGLVMEVISIAAIGTG